MIPSMLFPRMGVAQVEVIGLAIVRRAEPNLHFDSGLSGLEFNVKLA